jgi:excisionase family DNA binding protein
MAEIKILKKVRSDEFLTVEEAAEALGIKPTAIRNYLHANKLTTFKFKTLTLLSEKEVRLWKVRQGRYSHPKA